MSEQSTKSAKLSKQFGKLKNIFRSRSPSPSVAPPDVSVPSPPVVAVPPLGSSVDTSALVHPPPDIVVSPVDPESSDDLVSPHFVAPPINPASAAEMTLEEAAKLRAKYTQFRILVIGRANAGKTTLLKRVCNTKEDPVYDTINPTQKRGIHNVRDEFIFKNNPGFVFHDSPGFEAGGKKELEEVLSFIEEKAKSQEAKDQIHVIWFCFEPDVSRPLLELECTFFNKQRAGNVPVVAIFTKFDVLITRIYDRNKDDEENFKLACATLEKKFEKPLRGYKYPPRAYARFESIDEDEGNHQEQVAELIKQTTASIDNLALKMLFVTVQQNNLEVCIECAINQYIFRITYIHGLVFAMMTWFGHFKDMNKDYGKKENLRKEDLGGWQTGSWVKRVELVNYNSKLVEACYSIPSLSALAAILICLENSFWHAQQGSTLEDGFKMALNSYSTTKMDEQIQFQWPNDWFSTKRIPSQAEHTKFSKFILANRLSHPESAV